MQPSEKEGYKELFDMIRPQTGVEGPALWALLAFALVALVLIGGTAWVRHRRKQRRMLSDFHLLAEEKGLTQKEEQRLLEMARETSPRQLSGLFSSVAAFEQAVEQLVATDDPEPAEASLLKQLQSIRRKLGFDRLPARWTLRHTRQIPQGARVMVLVQGDELDRYVPCIVEETNASYLTLTPFLQRDQQLLSEAPLQAALDVRYWRASDTEYRFETRMLAGTPKDRTFLRVAHASRLDRLQQRDFFRLKVSIPTTLYDLPDPDLVHISQEDFSLPEGSQPILQGQIVDLSVGGCAISAENTLPIDTLGIIDPDIGGPFSIGRLICRHVKIEKAGDGRLLRFEFVNISSSGQDRLMRELYSEQQERAGV